MKGKSDILIIKLFRLGLLMNLRKLINIRLQLIQYGAFQQFAVHF